MARFVAVRRWRRLRSVRLPLAGIVAAAVLIPAAPPDAMAAATIWAAILAPTPGGVLPVGVPLIVTGQYDGFAEAVLVDTVEISVDGGASWLAANLDGFTWSLVYTPDHAGELTIMARAAFEDTRQATPPRQVTVTIGDSTAPPPEVSCPCQLALPRIVGSPEMSDPDESSVEVGIRFQLDRAGFITGLRISGNHLSQGLLAAHLWGPDGTMLASGRAIGMHTPLQVEFQPPVPVVADQTYVASYFTPVGHYDSAELYFGGVLLNPPFRTILDEAGGAGVYQYGDAPAFPTNTWNRSNYWVAPVFSV